MGKIVKTNYTLCKLGIILMLIHLGLSSFAQENGDQKISIFASNVPLRSVLKKIEKQSNRRFNYSDSELNTDEKISVKYDNVPLNSILSELLLPKGFVWKYIDNNIYLRKNRATQKERVPLNEIPRGDSLFSATFVGKVTDEKGLPLTGATVLVMNSNQGTVTDNLGKFTLKMLPENSTIVVSFTGFVEQKVSVTNHSNLVIALKEAANILDETVVIGYGNTTQRYSTGSISRVSSKEIGQQPVANPLSTLQGRMTGVFVTNGVGLPGSNVKVQIRGVNSISSGKEPLYIIDGVPFSSVPLNSASYSGGGLLIGANDYTSPLNSINPADIERIDVLKDADATAIYGSRAANGVVLITTKKGKSGKTKVDVNMYTGWEKASHLVKSVTTQQYLDIRKEAFANDGVVPDVQSAPDLFVFSQSAYTDFQKLIIGNTAKLTDMQLSISGGNDNTRFLVGGNFRKEGTIYPGDLSYRRSGAHFNLEHNASNNKFHTGITASYTSDNNNNLSQSINFNLSPNFPLYDSTGKLNFVYGMSPIAYTRQSSLSQTNTLLSSAQLRYEILPGLNIETNLGYNSTTLNSILTFPKSAINPNNFNAVNKARYGNSSIVNYIVEPQLNYIKNISQGKLQLLVGGTWQSANSRSSFIQGEKYSNDGLLKDLGSAGNISAIFRPSSTSTQYKYASVYGRVNYNWNNKYVINASFRRDGSSRFGTDKRFGNFGAAGLAWIFSNEEFLKEGLPLLSYGKLRASYGVVGNDQITDYQYLATYGQGYSYQGITGLYPSRIANPNYSWETNHKLEAATELGFWKDRILLTVAWFRNRTNNQLVGYALPSQTGFTSYQANLPALIQNKGWEFGLNTINLKTKDFSWTSSINISFIDNKLISFPGLSSSPYADTYVEGESVSIVKGFHFVNINPQTGIPSFTSTAGKDTIEPSYASDRVVMGRTNPKYFGGFSNSVTYKGFQLDFLFQFVKQQGYLPQFWPGLTKFLTPEALNRWQKPGDITDVPKGFTYNANNDAATAYSAFLGSDRFWGDASYIRLKNVAVSYNLSKEWLSRMNINQVRIYLQAQNLFTITKYPGSDPELPNQFYTVPTLKIVTVGIQASF